MKKIIIIFFALALISCTKKSDTSTNSNYKVSETTNTSFKPASSFFPKEKTQILVVGTFHMDYPGLDTHKTNEDEKIDVLTEPKKSEITELVTYIKKFNPTKIAVEASPYWNATQKLREYKDGKHRDRRDETFQIAMRIANDLQLDTIYGVNANSLLEELWEKDSITAIKFTNNINWDVKDPVYDMQFDWYKYQDKMTSNSNLLEYFKYINSQESHNYGYGAYLTGSFKDQSNQGADHLSLWWYNRNLRIFRNIIGITESPEDRIMVLMGNGHAAVLRQIIEVSPEFEFVEFNSL